MEKAQKWFEISGIVPYRPNVFISQDFLPTTLSIIPAGEADQTVIGATPSTSKLSVIPPPIIIRNTICFVIKNNHCVYT